MSAPVLVIGGTGKVGSSLVRRLVDAGDPVRSASRSGAGAPGAEGVAFDWFDQGGHARAVSGVRSVFMVAPIGSSTPIDVMEPFVEQAMAAGVRRFVLLSSSMIEEGGPAMGEVHALLRRRAPEWAVVRPSWFMENFSGPGPHLASIVAEDAIYSATGDGIVPFITVEDIAEASRHLLTDATIAEPAPVLTGPEAITYAQVAEIIGRARGRPVRHVPLGVDQLEARLQSFGIPEAFAAMLAGMDGAIAGGAEARTSPAVEEITGSAPTTFQAYAAANAPSWTRPGA